MPEYITKEDLQPILKSMSRIETALLGDEAMEVEGLAKKVARHEKHVKGAYKRAGWLTGISATAGVMLHQLWEFITGSK